METIHENLVEVGVVFKRCAIEKNQSYNVVSDNVWPGVT